MLERSDLTGEGMEGFRAADFISEGLPEGYETAWSWLAKNEPNAFEFMLKPGSELVDIENRAAVVAREENIAGIEVPSPIAILSTGGPTSVKVLPNILYRYIFAT